MKYPTAQPRIASYVIIKNDAGKVAFLLRNNTGWMNGYYSLPAGKVENGESFTEAAIREGLEEAGIKINQKHLTPVFIMHRNQPEDIDNTWVDVYFKAAGFKGQPYNAEPHVHSELAWLDPKNLPENIVPSVKAAFEFMAKGKKFAEWGWDK